MSLYTYFNLHVSCVYFDSVDVLMSVYIGIQQTADKTVLFTEH